MTIRGQVRNYFRPALSSVQTLLREAQLPSSDLTAAHLEHFIGCGSADALDGVVGLEMYPPYALLRSLTVAPSRRNAGLGHALVSEAERHAGEHGAREIYLLTTTAERFFERAGYERVLRDAAPQAIRATQEYASICPVTSAFMRKRLG